MGTFHKYGPSGTVEKKDGLCVLPLNIINEKIYIFIWFWLVFLAVVTGLVLLYRFALILGTQIRVAIIATKGTKKTKRDEVEAILESESEQRGFLVLDLGLNILNGVGCLN